MSSLIEVFSEYQQYGFSEDITKYTNLNEVNNFNETALMIALTYHNFNNLNLSQEQWDYLIKNTDLSITSTSHATALVYAVFSQHHDYDLTDKQMSYLIDNTDILALDFLNYPKENFMTLVSSHQDKLKLTNAQLSKIVNIMINKKTKQSEINKVLNHIECVFVEKNKNLMTYIWPYIEDKNRFMKQIENRLFCMSSGENQLLKLPEMIAFKEREKLSGKITQLSLSKSTLKI